MSSRAILCSSCRRLIAGDERRCPYCDALAPGLGGAATRIDRLFVDLSVEDIILVGCGGLYLLQLLVAFLVAPEALFNPRSFFELGSVGGQVSVLVGAANGELLLAGQLWRLLTASWLHGSLMHIGFNMWAARSLIQLQRQLLGSARAINVWILSGAGGMLAASLLSGGVTVGASTSIFGLGGALAVFGWRRGGTIGKGIRDSVLRWVVMSTLLTLGMGNVSHVGHAGGFIAGALVGLALPAHESVREGRGARLLAIALSGLTALSFAMALWFAASMVGYLGARE